MEEPLSIQQVNAMDYDDFIARFGNVIEHCALCAAAIWRHRPFQSIEELHSRICSFLHQLPASGKEGVLRLHPDLAGRLAMQGGLTLESKAEQKAAGLDTMTDEERSSLQEANRCYKEKFGFPFVICARQNKKEAILSGISHRLNNTPEQELETGMGEVEKICLLRLQQLLQE